MVNNLTNRFEEVAREDLLMFINACLSCTGQREFYDSDYGQKVSLDFLHDYILGNYRLLYCRTLAAGINHFNQTQIILKLLATGKATQPQHREEENQLITATLHNLPSHRAWNLLVQIRKQGINNRRARAIVKHYINSRIHRFAFDAVKYHFLDRSYSSSGSSEKRRRPLGIALAIHYLLSLAAREYGNFWTIPTNDPFLVTPRGQTDIATPLLSALAWQPELVIIVSDGWENDPPAATAELLRVYRRKIDPDSKVSIIHCNPVFNADDFTLKRISPLIPTVGLREAEDLELILKFARFAEGTATLAELEAYLKTRSQQVLRKNERRR